MSRRKNSVDRRNFLKIAAGSAAALSTSAEAAGGQQPQSVASETGPAVDVLTTDRPGSDFMVDVLKTLDIEYIASNPASSFRCLQESLINYGNNKSPEWLTCMHEESSVGMARGYFKIEGKPMAAILEHTVVRREPRREIGRSRVAIW